MVFFSATQVKGKCPANFKATRHRSWFVTSRDMRTFSAPRRLLTSVSDSVIDLFPVFDVASSPAAAAELGAATTGGSIARRRHVLLYKSEHNVCERHEWSVGQAPRAERSQCTLVLRIATAANASGPWEPDAGAEGTFFDQGSISRPCAEGPAAVRLPSGEWLVYFDGYRTDCPLRAPPPCGLIAGRRVQDFGLQDAALGLDGGAAASADC
eukprot:7382425-Prymnesium_polylepis.1